MEFINEAIGDFPEYDKEMEKFLPVVWNDIKGGIQTILPLTTSRLTKEEEIIKKYIKNINIEIRLQSGTSRNAYTYPAMESKTQAQITNLPILGFLYFIYKSSRLMSNEKIFNEVKFNNGLVIFPSKAKKYKFLVFVTKGLITTLTEEERVAVILHEIGHWAKVKPTIYGATERLLQGITSEAQKKISVLISSYINFSIIIHSPYENCGI